MGSYTRLFFNASLRYDTPPEVREVLRYMSGTIKDQPETPEHPLFRTNRWDVLFKCSSAYHDGQFCQNHIPDKFKPMLFFCADLKNYNEIELFYDWIHQYIDAWNGKFLGFVHFDEDDLPVVIRYTDKGIEIAGITDVKWEPFEC